MKKIFYLIPLLALCLIGSSCSHTNDTGHLTITGDSTVFRSHRLKSYHRIAQQETINVHLHIVTDSIPYLKEGLKKKATITFLERNRTDAAITYLYQRNLILVEVNTKYEVPMQKGLDKDLFRLQLQNETFPGYQAIDTVMHIVAKAKQMALASKTKQTLSFFSKVRKELQWVITPSDKWFYFLLFQPAFELSQQTILLFHSLRWPVIVLAFLYLFLSLFRVFKDEAETFCKVTQTLVLICLVYILLFCSPSLENYIYGSRIRDILFTSYTAHTSGLESSRGWGIAAIVLEVLEILRDAIVVTYKKTIEHKDTSLDEAESDNKAIALGAVLISVFVLPKVLLQAICLILGCKLVAKTAENIKRYIYLKRGSSKPFHRNAFRTYTHIGYAIVMIYLFCGFVLMFLDVVTSHQPWGWLHTNAALNRTFIGIAIFLIIVPIGLVHTFLKDFTESLADFISISIQVNRGRATQDDKANASMRLFKYFLYTFAMYAIMILGVYLGWESIYAYYS